MPVPGEQARITAWFDDVYATKGLRYLRPVRAYRVFPTLLKLGPADRLLDVACGLGLMLEAASAVTGHLHGVDISRVAVAGARRRVPEASVLVGNVQALPFADATFDCVTCLGSLERVIDPDLALREIRRVGTASARYCFLVRNSNTFSWKRLGVVTAGQRQASHAGADTLDNWTQRFASAGFRIRSVWPDQYPLQRKAKWLSWPRERVDFAVPLKSRRPLDKANEFVFVLENGS